MTGRRGFVLPSRFGRYASGVAGIETGTVGDATDAARWFTAIGLAMVA